MADARISYAIGQASQRTGVDFDYLWNQARVESSLDPGAKAKTSSAAGLYQFIEQSWLSTVKKHGAAHGYQAAAEAIKQRSDGRYTVSDPEARRAILAMRYDPDASAAMAAEFASDNADYLTRRIGRTPNATDLYFAHFLGAGGASSFLKAAAATPDAAAAAQFPREAAANRSIFYTRSGEARSFADVYALMGNKLGGSGAAAAVVAPSYAGGFAPGLRLMAEPPADGMTWGGHIAQQEAVTELDTADTLEARPMDMLRPNPQSARLAYMLVVSSLT
ncbi:hypothetical protein [Sphingobium boeckii]|uniref:Lytic transglycosylase domain-containing protein n=1 Tax=Sphingobium boeckii TaxID=1082345 RepID=A0A7W9EEX6_9SPHN|nr:hypothetical protein [Sphingobium boeckii]MBB5686479.1 hypothetical protein [Sphingobium boeckii]